MSKFILGLLFGLASYCLGMLTVSVFAAGRIARLERENERLKRWIDHE